VGKGFDPFEVLARANPVDPDSARAGADAEALLAAILTAPTQDSTPGNLSSVSWNERDDAELLHGALHDREAFGVFYEQNALAVYRWFAYRVQREGTVAAELTAETFAEALRSLPRFRGTQPGSGVSWLFGIARNLAREHHRSRRIRRDARRELGMPRNGGLDEALQDADERLDATELRERLVAAIALLPRAQREAITMRVVEELEYPAIAAAADTTEQAVRLRVSRGLRALRVQLTPATHEED
jgi:RNA polymerase sigma-70 factor (ECF subfamily)